MASRWCGFVYIRSVLITLKITIYVTVGSLNSNPIKDMGFAVCSAKSAIWWLLRQKVKSVACCTLIPNVHK
jgi:hypothetical protein